MNKLRISLTEKDGEVKAEITALKKEKNVHKSKYLAIHPNKCGPQDSLGIDYHWCGNGQGGAPNVELQFDPTTGNLVGVVFIPKDARWGDTSNA